jgi:hypothetical protein
MPSSTDAEKAYTLTFEHREGYLYARVEGVEDSYEISRAFWLEVAAEAKRVGAGKVIIDEAIEQNATLTDVFLLASELPQMGFGRTLVAFVDRYLDHEEVNEFGGIVAANRGFSGGVFNNLEDAKKFLQVAD